MHQQEREKIIELVEQLLSDSDYDLVDVVLTKQSGTYTVTVLVDLPQGGIGLGQCAEVNRMIDQAMLDQGMLDGQYALEVSSPGLDRPLMDRKDFLRSKGRQVRVFLKEKVSNQTEHIGTIHQVGDDDVVIVEEGKEISLPFNKITKAIQIIS